MKNSETDSDLAQTTKFEHTSLDVRDILPQLSTLGRKKGMNVLVVKSYSFCQAVEAADGAKRVSTGLFYLQLQPGIKRARRESKQMGDSTEAASTRNQC